jgi:hypothetical protein
LYALHVLALNRLMTPAAPTWTAIQPNYVPLTVPQDVTAVGVLAVRAARRAIVASPDHPDGYYYLALAYGHETYSTTEDLRELVTTVSRARARARVPADPADRRPTFDVLELCRALTVSHLRDAAPPRLDLALDVFKLAGTYLRQDIDDKEAALPGKTGDARDAAEADLDKQRRQLTEVEKQVTDLGAVVEKNTVLYINRASGQTSALDRAAVARRLGLVREATAELMKAHEQFQKQLDDRPDRGPEWAALAGQLAAYAELIELLWYDGRVEEAGEILDTIDTTEVLRLMEGPAIRDQYQAARQRAMNLLFPDPRQRPTSAYDANPAAHFRALRRGLALIVGDFERAAESQAREAQVATQELTQFKARVFPGDIPDPATMPDPQTMQRELYTRPVLAPVAFAGILQMRNLYQLLELSRSRAEGRVRLGMTCLEWGNVPDAAKHFRQAQDAPGFTTPLPVQRSAREYLRGIDRATGGRGGSDP